MVSNILNKLFLMHKDWLKQIKYSEISSNMPKK